MTPCPHCADAAALRRAFYAATEELVAAKAGLPANHPAIAIWGRLYEAVRDHTAGVRLLAELARLDPEFTLAGRAPAACG